MDPNPHGEFLEHYQPVHDKFVRYCSSHAYGIMEADDLVQESVLSTMKAFHSVRDKNKLLPFMITVANNIIRNTLRRKKFNALLSEKHLLNLENHVTDPDVKLDIHYLYKALNKLSMQDKEAVILFEISGFSMIEIAGIQHTSEGATRVRIHRARIRLRELLTTEGVELESRNGKTLFSFIL